MNNTPSAAPVPKVWAATAGSGFGGALGAIVVYSLGVAGLDVPPEIGIAVATACSVIVTFIAGYLTPPKGG